MSTQNIIDKIIADANTEAEAIIQTAEDKANGVIANATAEAERIRKETEQSVLVQTQSILEKKILPNLYIFHIFKGKLELTRK